MNTILNRTSKPTFRSRRIVRLIFLLTLLAFALAACGSDNEVADDTTREDAAEDKTLSVNQVIENQPTEDMAFSPTRETINFWMEPGVSQVSSRTFTCLQKRDSQRATMCWRVCP